jgi:alkanesulfonate monooxygenase SsuD/methylene tetrahydromethanopterin reductase-like flavin-dependent oxidoreductase (luciferase family)
MKFQLAINMERIAPDTDMREVQRHTLEMVQMADRGGFDIVWAAEHHALEMTIAPNPFQSPPTGTRSTWPARRRSPT